MLAVRPVAAAVAGAATRAHAAVRHLTVPQQQFARMDFEGVSLRHPITWNRVPGVQATPSVVSMLIARTQEIGALAMGGPPGRSPLEAAAGLTRWLAVTLLTGASGAGPHDLHRMADESVRQGCTSVVKAWPRRVLAGTEHGMGMVGITALLARQESLLPAGDWAALQQQPLPRAPGQLEWLPAFGDCSGPAPAACTPAAPPAPAPAPAATTSSSSMPVAPAAYHFHVLLDSSEHGGCATAPAVLHLQFTAPGTCFRGCWVAAGRGMCDTVEAVGTSGLRRSRSAAETAAVALAGRSRSGALVHLPLLSQVGIDPLEAVPRERVAVRVGVSAPQQHPLQ